MVIAKPCSSHSFPPVHVDVGTPKSAPVSVPGTFVANQRTFTTRATGLSERNANGLIVRRGPHANTFAPAFSALK
jgi:hypothetical protein